MERLKPHAARVAFALGALLWLLSPVLSGSHEAWDAPGYYLLTLTLAGVVPVWLGAPIGRAWFAVVLGEAAGVVLNILVVDPLRFGRAPNPGLFFPLGVTIIVLWSVPAALGAALGAATAAPAGRAIERGLARLKGLRRARGAWLAVLALPALAWSQDAGLLDRAKKATAGMPDAPGAPAPARSVFSVALVPSPTLIDTWMDQCPGKGVAAGCCKTQLKRRGPRFVWEQGAPNAAGLVPVWARAITVRFELAQAIHIAPKYPEGSCPYDFILAHERTHSRDASALARTWRAQLKEELERTDAYEPRAGSAENPVLVPADGVERHKVAVEKKVLDLIVHRHEKADDSVTNQMKKTISFRDSPESYEEVRAAARRKCL